MTLEGDLRLPDRPPIHVAPDMLAIVVALPLRMMLDRPCGITLAPLRVVMPDVMVIKIAPPFRMILRRPLWLIQPPP
jgi:hypothetical protein